MSLYTPLRYPGGKRRLASVVARLLEANGLRDVQYVEPYAGGAAIALHLLMEEHASVVHINDLARPVFAFWHTVLNDSEWLCARLRDVRATMTTWRRQRAVYRRADSADLRELGFASFFLNRTNRSGILSGGVIGGLDQSGPWKLDARLGRENLGARIRRIARYADRISLTQMDAAEFTTKVIPALGKNVFVFYDPPYIERGTALYLNDYTVSGHKKLASKIERLACRWVVTYDRESIAHGLYDRRRRIVYDLHYVAQNRCLGREVMFMSDSLVVPPMARLLDPTMHLVRGQTRLKAS